MSENDNYRYVGERKAIIESIAKAIDEDFSWILPMSESREINEATDDAACSVQDQIVTFVRKLAEQIA